LFFALNVGGMTGRAGTSETAMTNRWGVARQCLTPSGPRTRRQPEGPFTRASWSEWYYGGTAPPRSRGVHHWGLQVRYLTVLLSLALASTLTACGGDSTGPSETYSGTYTLRTINGTAVPYVIIQLGADKVEIASGTVTMSDNGTNGGSYTYNATVRTTVNGQVSTETQSDQGNYTRTGTGWHATSTVDGTTSSGTLSGGTLTLVETIEGTVYSFVFQK